MELDFTRLNSLAYMGFTGKITEKQPDTSPQNAPNDSGQYKTTPERGTPADGLTSGEKRLQREADQNRAANQRALSIYQTYQQNIKTSGQLQTEILKGAKQGESVYTLFLKAAKAICLMTSNELFYNQIEADIKAIYGAGLLEPLPLEWEHDAVQERLTRLRAAYERDGEAQDSRQRIANAIKAHEGRAEYIRGVLSPALESV